MRAKKVESLIRLECPVGRKRSDDQPTGRISINKNDLVILLKNDIFVQKRVADNGLMCKL